jgi:L-lactate dehydrogenase complex protein LldF
MAMKAAGFALSTPGWLSAAQAFARIAQVPFEHDGLIRHLPGQLGGWTDTRDLVSVPKQSFRQWWRERERSGESHT